MQCPDCKNEGLPGKSFCDHCGRSLSDLVHTSDIQSAVQANGQLNPDRAVALVSNVAEPTPPPPTVAKLMIKENGTLYEIALGSLLSDRDKSV